MCKMIKKQLNYDNIYRNTFLQVQFKMCLLLILICIANTGFAQIQHKNGQPKNDNAQSRLETIRAVQKANDHYYEKRYAQAIEAYQTLLKGDLTVSQKGSVRLMLGQSYVRLSKDAEAKKILTELINEAPNGTYATQAVHQLTSLYRQRYQIKEAIVLSKHLVKQHPDTAVAAVAAYLNAYFEYMDGQFDAAIESYKLFLKNYPDSIYTSTAINSLVRLYTANEKFAEAEKLINERIKLNPSDTSLLEELAKLYQQQGKYQKSLELYKNVLEKNPNSATIREKLGSLYIEIGDKEKAIAEWEKMVTDGFNRYQQLGTLYLSHKMYDEAIEAFLKAIQAYPTYGYLYTQLAFAYKIQGNIDKAARTYLEGLRQIGSSASQRESIWEAMLEIYQGEQQKPLREKLIAEYRNALKTSPNNLNTAIILGELYFYDGQFDDTLKTFKLVHGFFPTTIEAALQRLARILERDRDPQAITFFTTMLGLSRNINILTNTRYSLAKIYQNLEQWDQAAATLKELDKNSAASIEGKLMRAKIQLYGLQNPKEAQITLQPLLTKRLDHSQYMQVQLTLGEIHLLLGRYTLARQVLTPIADSINPFSSSARKLIGDSYLFATEFDQALKEYRKAVLRTQSDKLTNDALERIVLIQANTDYLGIPISDYVNALQHYLSGDAKTAIVQCEDTISLHNKSLIVDDMWMLLGRIHRSQKSFGDAIHSFRQVVTLESSLAPHALTNIAEIYQQKQDWTNALETYTTLLTTFPNNTIVPHARQQMDNVTKNIKNTGSNTP